MKIGVIGDRQSVQGFAALSIDVYPATSERNIKRLINTLAKDRYAIIFITEQAASLVPETIENYNTSPFPAIIPIPGNQGSMGVGQETIRRNVEKAIGTNIFFDE